MADCKQIDSLVTPYVDDDLERGERETVDRHLGACRSCRARVQAERAVHALIRGRRSVLTRNAAPSGLQSRCALLARSTRAQGRGTAALWRARLVPIALAASLVLIVFGAFLYELTARSTVVLAAELTSDHLKCFRVINSIVGAQREPAAIEASMASRFDWPMRLPEHADRAGLELVGVRPCLYGEGFVAHIMYMHKGHPVSVFMLPRSARSQERLDVMGHHAAIWSVGNRTFVLVSDEPAGEVEQMTSFVHDALR
jgi:anti-sigma factor RsiW